MNILTKFVRVGSLSDLDALRREYLDGLHAAQELMLEVLVPSAECYAIETKGVRCGYFLVHASDTLVEFHLSPPYWVFGEAVFRQILERLPIRAALVKSFDHLFLSSCIAHQKGVVSRGMLVRDYVARALPAIPSIRFESRPATLADLPAIEAIDQSVFTHPERLRKVIAEGYTLLFSREDACLGFGIIRPVVPGRPDVDLGIAVDARFRNKGYAVYMFRDMVAHCHSRGLRPVAGCADENVASRRMGERVGMVSRYRLLELRF